MNRNVGLGSALHQWYNIEKAVVQFIKDCRKGYVVYIVTLKYGRETARPYGVDVEASFFDGRHRQVYDGFTTSARNSDVPYFPVNKIRKKKTKKPMTWRPKNKLDLNEFTC